MVKYGATDDAIEDRIFVFQGVGILNLKSNVNGGTMLPGSGQKLWRDIYRINRRARTSKLAREVACSAAKFKNPHAFTNIRAEHVHASLPANASGGAFPIPDFSRPMLS